MSETERFECERVVVSYDATRCIGARECMRALPAVFDVGRRPRVDPTAASAASIAEVVMRCPSGALHFERLDGGPEEPTPARNMVTVTPDGPLHVRGELVIETSDGPVHDTRASLCRCGASGNKPFCDGSHRDAGFSHGGGVTLGKPIAPPLTDRDGPLHIRPSRRGPLLFSGVLELRSADLSTFARLQHPALCRCGRSDLKPFCDATHLEVGFDG
ncbi:MAG: CDGSH iron-sulfur domain-containing protein [Gemmatimonadales bacterium]